MNLSNLRTMIMARLSGDTDLAALLAPDPLDPTCPAVLWGTLNDHAPVYPCLTCRVATHLPDSRFQPTAAEGGGQSPIVDVALEIECWSLDTAVRDALSSHVCRLFDGKRIAYTGGAAFGTTLQTALPDLPRDMTTEAYPALLRFRLKIYTS